VGGSIDRVMAIFRTKVEKSEKMIKLKKWKKVRKMAVYGWRVAVAEWQWYQSIE
jgi:hypothetical protein